MKVSIIIPVYNVEKYIARCLDSIINQEGNHDFEVIIVNDGSPDNSQQFIDEYVKRYPSKIKSFVKINGGVSSARNFGLEKANGNYVTFIDPDDYIYPEYLKTIFANVSEKNKIIIFDYDFIDQKVKKIHKKIFLENKEYMLGKQASWTRVVHKSLYDGLDFPNGIVYEDLAVIPYIVAKCNQSEIKYISRPLYAYTVDAENSIMNTYNRKIFDIYPALEHLFNLFKDNGMYEEYRDELQYLALEHLGVGHGYRLLRYPEKTWQDFKDIAVFMETNFGKQWDKNKFIKQKIHRQNISSGIAYVVPLYLKVFKLLFSTRGGNKQ